MKQKYSKQKVFCLDDKMDANINLIAEEASTTSSEVIRECIRMYLPRIRARIKKEAEMEAEAAKKASEKYQKYNRNIS